MASKQTLCLKSIDILLIDGLEIVALCFNIATIDEITIQIRDVHGYDRSIIRSWAKNPPQANKIWRKFEFFVICSFTIFDFMQILIVDLRFIVSFVLKSGSSFTWCNHNKACISYSSEKTVIICWILNLLQKHVQIRAEYRAGT